MLYLKTASLICLLGMVAPIVAGEQLPNQQDSQPEARQAKTAKERKIRAFELSILQEKKLTPGQLDIMDRDCLNNGALKELYGNSIAQREAILNDSLIFLDTTFLNHLHEQCKTTINRLQECKNQEIEQKILTEEIVTKEELEGIKKYCFPGLDSMGNCTKKLMAIRDGHLPYMLERVTPFPEQCKTVKEEWGLRVQQQKEAAKKAKKEIRAAERKKYRDENFAAENPAQS